MQTRIETASNKGNNCAFNAFLLGLCEPQVLNHLAIENPEQKLAAFIEMLKTALRYSLGKNLSEFTWEQLKEELIKYKKQHPKTCQEDLGPHLRKLAIDLARKDAFYPDATWNVLSGAFDMFVQGRESGDDIFLRHPFIKQKFIALKSQPNPSIALENWWRQEGCKNFLTAMEAKGPNAEGYLAGDLELAQLARYFGVNLKIHVKNVSRPYMLDALIDHGFLSLDVVTKYQLDQRGISDENGNLKPMTESELKTKIVGLANTDQIVAAWKKAYKNPPVIQLELVSTKEGPHYNNEVVGPAPKIEIPNPAVKQANVNPSVKASAPASIPTVNFAPKATTNPAPVVAPKVTTSPSSPMSQPPKVTIQQPKATTPPLAVNPKVTVPPPQPPKVTIQQPKATTPPPVMNPKVTIPPAVVNPKVTTPPSSSVKSSVPPAVKRSAEPLFSTVEQQPTATKSSSPVVPKPTNVRTSNANTVANTSELIRATQQFFEALREGSSTDAELLTRWSSELNKTGYRIPVGTNRETYLEQMHRDRELAIQLQLDELRGANANKPRRKR